MRRAVAVAAVAAAGVMAGGAMIWQSQARDKASETALPEVKAILTAAPLVPPPVDRPGNAKVIVNLETTEVKGTLADGVQYTFWTFGGTVPGPFVRVRVNDVVQIRLKNAEKSMHPHSIDLHAVTGPGGGAAVTQLGPGQEGAFEFKALNPGLYVYHCATPSVPEHIASALLGDAAVKAKVGETVRLFVGNGGPNLISSFHVIGAIFDTGYTEGAVGGSTPAKNVQTTLVPAGGAAIVELKVQEPGRFLLVDHSIVRAMEKGALGMLEVAGAEQPGVFRTLVPGTQGTGGH